MSGIVAYGAYVPYWRLDRARIGEALRTPAGKGTRAVASFDEDTTTMGVEAARTCLASATTDRARPGQVLFATADAAYLDKTNATAIHAALGLDPAVAAFDVGGAVRSGTGALRLASMAPLTSLVVLSDVRGGLAGGADESQGGDAAAAFLVGPDEVVAERIGEASTTAEFLDRWRVPGEHHSRVWEERFGEHVYVPLADEAFTEALKGAELTADDVDHLVVTGVHARSARAFTKRAGVRPESLADDLSASLGNAGTAQAGLALVSVFDRASPDAVIASVNLADGVDVTLWRSTAALAGYRERRPEGTALADQVAAGRDDLDYPRFLTWRGQLRREPPRRPDPTPPAAPPAFRKEDWKFGFTASRCEQCGTRHLPPARVCIDCGAVDRMAPERLADTRATIATFTVDRLTYSPSPPLVAAVIDFDGGGRYRCEVTDVDPDAVAIGDRVQMTFRRISTVNGVHNYAWKAKPAKE